MKTSNRAGIRCFVAVEVPASIQTLLMSVQTDLQSRIHKASWTKSGNFHFTLKFLGDVRSDVLEAVSGALQRVAAAQPRFNITLGGLGAFPNLVRPRVLWMGIKQGGDPMSRLAKAVNLELASLGFSTDSRFHAHLTLARLRTSTNLEPLKNILRKYDTIVGESIPVNALVLMQSQLHRSGAVYTPLNVCDFSAKCNTRSTYS